MFLLVTCAPQANGRTRQVELHRILVSHKHLLTHTRLLQVIAIWSSERSDLETGLSTVLSASVPLRDRRTDQDNKMPPVGRQVQGPAQLVLELQWKEQFASL